MKDNSNLVHQCTCCTMDTYYKWSNGELKYNIYAEDFVSIDTPSIDEETHELVNLTIDEYFDFIDKYEYEYYSKTFTVNDVECISFGIFGQD